VTSVFQGGAEGAELADMDADGQLDAFVSWSNSVVVAYGPLDLWNGSSTLKFGGCYEDMAVVPADSACIFVSYDGWIDTIGSHEVHTVRDVTGDDVPDLLVVDWGDWSEGRTGAAIVGGGDHRGSMILAPSEDTVVSRLGTFYPVLGDVDRDGADDVAVVDGVMPAAELSDDAAMPNIQVAGSPSSGIVSVGDMDRDGVAELQTVVDGVQVLFSGDHDGVLPADPFDPLYTVLSATDGEGNDVNLYLDSLSNPLAVGDITGDGGTDIVRPAAGRVVILASDDLFPLE
jgi:hypothetical protein